MLDALAASDARARLAKQLPGGAAAAECLVPVQPAEEEARARAAVLMGALGGRLQGPGATFQVGGSLGVAPGALRASCGACWLPVGSALRAATRLGSLPPHPASPRARPATPSPRPLER